MVCSGIGLNHGSDDRGSGGWSIFGVGGDDRFMLGGEVEHGEIVKGEWGSENELS